MFRALFLFLYPALLMAFVPHSVTPSPVVGFQEIIFGDVLSKTDRQVLAWYPVGPDVEGSISSNPWDLFRMAKDTSPVSSNGSMPVIVISHGYTGNPHQMSWLIRNLVHSGFIVLGIQHRDLIDSKVHMNHWQRALDVKIVLDQFSGSELAKAADLSKIGIAGFSLGGTTAIWTIGGRSTKLDTLIPTAEFSSPEDYVMADAALPTLNKEMMAKDLRDPRIKAAFIMAPAWSWLFDEKSLEKVQVPTYLIAASEDKILVTKNNAGFFARHIPHAIYQEIRGRGNHFIFISALDENAAPRKELSYLFQDDASIDRRWIQFEVCNEATRFFHSIFNT